MWYGTKVWYHTPKIERTKTTQCRSHFPGGLQVFRGGGGKQDGGRSGNEKEEKKRRGQQQTKAQEDSLI